jgi:outer membrane protein assembly factor BamB
MKRLITAVLVLILLFTFTAIAKTQTPSWPYFHGPKRDNISTETGLLKSWPTDGPKLLWKFSDCGLGYSGPAIVDGMIFTAGDFNDVEYVIALDTNGKELWRTPNGSSWTGSHPGSRTTPTYDKGVLYHMNPVGRIAALKARSGKEIWAIDLQEAFGAKFGIWAMSENLIVDGGLVFCLPGGEKALAAALDKKTGKVVWTNNDLDETAAYCTPAIVTYKGRRLLLTLSQRSLIGLDAKTGELLFSHPHITPHDQNITVPVFKDGHIFIASGHSGGGRLLKINDDVNSVEEVWFNEELDNCHGGIILQDGYLYGSACKKGGKGFFCVDMISGDVKYMGQIEKVSLTSADDNFYAITQKGLVFLIPCSSNEFKITCSFQLPMESNIPTFAHPVICGGKLYLRQDNNLYAFDIKE